MKKWIDSEDYQNKWLDELKSGGKQMKLNKNFFIFLGGLLLALAVLGLAIFAWQCHLKQEQLQKAKEERETYESLIYYTGTFTIDDYSFLENGTGVVVHWKSENPEEDALVRKYATLKNADEPVQVTIGARNANYIVRENMKLPSGPNYLDKKMKVTIILYPFTMLRINS